MRVSMEVAIWVERLSLMRVMRSCHRYNGNILVIHLVELIVNWSVFQMVPIHGVVDAWSLQSLKIQFGTLLCATIQRVSLSPWVIKHRRFKFMNKLIDRGAFLPISLTVTLLTMSFCGKVFQSSITILDKLS
jgi:hypothetical protein